jgi:outer membrane protein OmpA-like peptidoglycan-associated protein
MSRLLRAAILIAAFTASGTLAADRKLPPWFPMAGLSTNPDQVEVEDFGSEEFQLGESTVTLEGHRWSAPLYGLDPNGPWDGPAVWKALRPALEKQGFKVLHATGEDSVDATLRRGQTYLGVRLTGDDGFSNSVRIIEIASRTRALKLVPPAAVPEALADDADFPYVTSLAGAKLLNTQVDVDPLDVSGPDDQEPRLAGSGTISKLYEGPAGVSEKDFTLTYQEAFRAAGWTAMVPGAGIVVAHFAKNGRDVWARLYIEGVDRWNIVVADVGSALRAQLDKGCKAALYGLNFDFDKATLRPDSEPTLQQALAALRASEQTTFALGGHTDNVGSKKHNVELSGNRAASVKQWLVKHGIAADRLSTKGFGDAMPVVPNDSAAHRARNRRVELVKVGCEQK